MPKIDYSLWLDTQAEEAAEFYTSVFTDSKMGKIAHYANAGQEVHGKPAGSVLTAEFDIHGQHFMALNGGPNFTINPSISFFVNLDTPEEVDALWAKLSQGSDTVLMPLDTYDFSERYGWLQDKFGLSWQISVAAQTEQKIVPSLLFVGDKAGKAEEAMNFYASVFKGAHVDNVYRYGEDQAPNTPEMVMYGDMTMEGQKLAVMDSADEHAFTFNEAVSFMVNCETQAEIDYYWEKLSAVPEAEQCGWLKDKYGVSWQITPTILNEFADQGEAADRMMAVFMNMKKIDIAALKAAYDGKD